MPATRLLLTRPYEQSVRFADQVASRFGTSFDTLVSPVIGIEPHGPLPGLGGYRGLIFTSPSGVEVFGTLGGSFPGTAWCVGARTAEVARTLGLATRSAGGTASLLVDLIAGASPDGPLLHLRGEHAASDVDVLLREHGIACDSHVIYHQPAMPLSDAARVWLSESLPIVLPVFSPRTARLLNPELNAAQAPFRIAAMSPVIADALDVQTGWRIEVADRPDAEAMLESLGRLVS